MPSSQTYILDDLPTDTDSLEFTPYVETLIDVCKSASRPLTIDVFGTWGERPRSFWEQVRELTYNPDMATPTAFQVPPLNQRKRIPMKTIRAIAAHIAGKFDPEQIILFGSHAYGKPGAWSDVDLLVVMDTPKGEMDAILEVGRALPRTAFRVDIVVRSREMLEKRKKLGDWFLREVTAKGKVLYERNN